jgi:hypothetical protein
MNEVLQKLLLVIIVIPFLISGCATTPVQRSYITIQQPEVLIGVNGGEEFEVFPGDSLKIIETETCAEGRGICWKVSSANTGKVGSVNAELIQDRQEVYIEEKGRTFTNGIFQSKSPKMTINIDPEFKYAGFVSETKGVTSVGGGRELYIINDRYIFVSPIKVKKHENKLRKGMTIGFRKVETSYYSSELFSKVKNRLYVGVEQYDNKNYQYFIKKSYPKMKSPVIKYLFEKGGFIVPSCVLQKTIGRVMGVSNDMIMYSSYIEDISEHGFSCSAFPKNATSLDEEKIKFIEEFNDRAKLAFEIVLSQ